MEPAEGGWRMLLKRWAPHKCDCNGRCTGAPQAVEIAVGQTMRLVRRDLGGCSFYSRTTPVVILRATPETVGVAVPAAAKSARVLVNGRKAVPGTREVLLHEQGLLRLHTPVEGTTHAFDYCEYRMHKVPARSSSQRIESKSAPVTDEGAAESAASSVGPWKYPSEMATKGEGQVEIAGAAVSEPSTLDDQNDVVGGADKEYRDDDNSSTDLDLEEDSMVMILGHVLRRSAEHGSKRRRTEQE